LIKISFDKIFKNAEWYDISHKLGTKTNTWPGEPEVKVKSSQQFTTRNLTIYSSTIFTPLHASTHMDAPLHMIKGSKTIMDFPIELSITEALVVEAENINSVKTSHIPDGKLPTAIIFKTGYGKLEFHNFPYISEKAAKLLVKKGVSVVGIDSPSVDPIDSQTFEAHKILLSADIFILENLYLKNINSGKFILLIAPLKIEGAEASPIRPILIKHELI